MRVLSLFGGCEGLGVGLRQAGLSHVDSYDYNPQAVATAKANGFPATQRDLTRGQVSFMAPDLLTAGVPCPRFSRATSRTRANHMDLWPTALEHVGHQDPRWFLGETVKGMLSPSHGATASDVWRGLRELGYEHVSYVVLDAADFGCPTHRRRLFFVAGPKPIVWPAPTHGGQGQPRLRTLGDIMGPDDGLKMYGPECGRAGSEPWRISLPGAAVMTTEVKGTRASNASGWTFNGGPDRLSDSMFLATGRRRATWRECAKAVGFPDDFVFTGNVESRYRQIGNSISPVMGKALGQAIMEADTRG